MACSATYISYANQMQTIDVDDRKQVYWVNGQDEGFYDSIQLWARKTFLCAVTCCSSTGRNQSACSKAG